MKITLCFPVHLHGKRATHSFRCIVDSVSDEIARVEFPNQAFFSVPIGFFSVPPHEGDVYLSNGRTYTPAPTDTRQRKALMDSKLNALLKRTQERRQLSNPK